MQFKYKQERTFEKRKSNAENAIANNPNRVPVIVEKLRGSTLDDLKINKFIVPFDLSFGEFQKKIRDQMLLGPEEAIFLFVNKVFPTGNTLMGDIYKNHHDDDLLLYIAYANESVYGETGQNIE